MAPYLGNLSLWLSLFFAISQFFVSKKNKKSKFITISVIGLLISSLISFFLLMYSHVPSSFIALGCFGFIGIASILNLIFRIKFVSLMAKSLAPVGCIFSLISIVTGSLWGKPTWGIWWVWDARLTSMGILLLFYLAYIFTWKFVNNYEKANKISSVIGIIGLFNLPVIKYSVDWWSTLHQPSSISLTSAPTIHYTMLIPLIIMFLGMVIYSLIIFLMKYKTELMRLKLDRKNQK